jgi:hypothetical protein
MLILGDGLRAPAGVRAQNEEVCTFFLFHFVGQLFAGHGTMVTPDWRKRWQMFEPQPWIAARPHAVRYRFCPGSMFLTALSPRRARSWAR